MRNAVFKQTANSYRLRLAAATHADQ